MATRAITSPAVAAARSPRLWEVDAVRGVAVLAMVFFHLMWDLQFFGYTDVDVFSAPWQTFARIIGSTFMFVMGVSLTLDAHKYERDARLHWRHNFGRGASIFGAGMLVTLATYVVVGEQYVRFGILHLAGVSIILATPFVRARTWLSALAGVTVIAAGAYLQTLAAPFPWLIPFGVRQAGVNMVDYYPLLPWFGVVLLGIVFGRVAYPEGVRRFPLPKLKLSIAGRGLRVLGQHSLAIYLLHQPVLIALLLVAQLARSRLA